MKLVHKDSKLLVFAFIGSLIFHTLVVFALDFRFETRNQAPRILNVQLVPQSASPSAVTGTPEREHEATSEILDPVIPESGPEAETQLASSHQELSDSTLERNTVLSSEKSQQTTVPDVQLTESLTDVVNVLEPTPTSNERPQVSLPDLLKTAAAIARERSSEQTVRNIQGDEATNTEEEYYLKAWLKKIKEVGQLNYPQEAVEKKLYGKLRLYVSIKPDGSVKETRVVRSSGHEVLDEAAKNIVELASPFSAFPPSMRESLDLLEIVREWEFRREALVPSTDSEED